jgi:hypothetical protein
MNKIKFVNKTILSFEQWSFAYGVCTECAVSIIQVDRNTWLDDNCHRHHFQPLET